MISDVTYAVKCLLNNHSLKKTEKTLVFFYILLTVHLSTIHVNNQLGALFKSVYFTSLHVSSNPVLIIRRINCINTSSGIYHSV